MRRCLWLVLAVVVLIVAADAALWRYATQRLQAGLHEWVAAQRSAGWTIGMENETTGGYPLAAQVTVRDVSISGGRPLLPNGFSWQAGRVALRISLLHPATLRIDAPGAGKLRVANGPDVAYSADALGVGVPLLRGDPPLALAAHAGNLAIHLPERSLTVGHLTAQVGVAPAAAQGQAAVTVALAAAEVGLPPDMQWALGPRIATLSLDAALDGPLADQGGMTERATTWRNDGGVLEVRRLDADWGPLRLRSHARLGLDQGLQPDGSGNARIAGYDATADALAAHGIMAPSAAVAAKAVLSLLAHAPDDGGPSEVDVPLRLRKRTLSMRGVPLLKFSELDWPAE